MADLGVTPEAPLNVLPQNIAGNIRVKFAGFMTDALLLRYPALVRPLLRLHLPPVSPYEF
jgi:hypothetical protein